jgi:hypothetical protein
MEDCGLKLVLGFIKQFQRRVPQWSGQLQYQALLYTFKTGSRRCVAAGEL